MDTVEFLEKQSEKFKAGIDRHKKNRKAWHDFANRAEIYFTSLRNEAIARNLFENLYIVSPEKEYKGLPYIAFRWGNHPTGYESHTDATLTIEHGCTLHYAQAVNGAVFCIIYPFSSELHSTKTDFYLFKVFTDPSKITEHHLQKGIKMLFSCAHVTSFVGNASKWDHFRFWRLKIKSYCRRNSMKVAQETFGKIFEVLGLITGVTSIKR
jgi:hypothetical protein